MFTELYIKFINMINSKILIGIMSGTSLDGIDIALTRIDKKKISVLDFLHINYSAELKEKFLNFTSLKKMS